LAGSPLNPGSLAGTPEMKTDFQISPQGWIFEKIKYRLLSANRILRKADLSF
jgi:hypothetical protein